MTGDCRRVFNFSGAVQKQNISSLYRVKPPILNFAGNNNGVHGKRGLGEVALFNEYNK